MQKLYEQAQIMVTTTTRLTKPTAIVGKSVHELRNFDLTR